MVENKLITRECKYCKQMFESILLFDFMGHVRYCKENPTKEREKLLREEAIKRVLIKRHGLPKEFQVVCKYCQKKFEVIENEKDFPKKLAYYCSKSCANAGRHVVGTKIIKCVKCLKDIVVSKKVHKKTCSDCKPKQKINQKQKCEDILNGKIQGKIKRELLFKFGFKEQKCEICNIIDWQNQKLTFHVHHVDGNYLNNQLSNLQILCPNCHSQTENWGFRKRHKKEIAE